ncbi:hypothetical protein H0H81_009518 [Sphagnurus paluster]|uniref:Uncharacterized protein n=1 Tax=Sphagnurus paluster TaxID=117069 RepID=A0A9P7FPD3_9AGAR|nr:hypothetical protein H0H81_009518 [Sphagnurus paluster]
MGWHISISRLGCIVTSLARGSALVFTFHKSGMESVHTPSTSESPASTRHMWPPPTRLPISTKRASSSPSPSQSSTPASPTLTPTPTPMPTPTLPSPTNSTLTPTPNTRPSDTSQMPKQHPRPRRARARARAAPRTRRRGVAQPTPSTSVIHGTTNGQVFTTVIERMTTLPCWAIITGAPTAARLNGTNLGAIIGGVVEGSLFAHAAAQVRVDPHNA